jgi:hypothetical protein
MNIHPIIQPTQIQDPMQAPTIAPSTAPKVPTPSSISATPPQEVILVAGAAYPHNRGNYIDNTGKKNFSREKIGITFRNLCHNFVPRLAEKYPKAKITLFDFVDGNRQELKLDPKSTHSKPLPPLSTVVEEYGKLILNNYRYIDRINNKFLITQPERGTSFGYMTGISEFHKDEVSFDKYDNAYCNRSLKEKSISVRNVYEYLAKLGESASGSVVEFHIFSHAYHEGPILANTFMSDHGCPPVKLPKGLKTYPKKFLDKDARIADIVFATDGVTSTEVVDLNLLKDAFAKNSFAMIWGCDGSFFIAELFNQLRKLKGYDKMMVDLENSAKAGKSPEGFDTPLIEFKFNQEWGVDEDGALGFHNTIQDSEPSPKGKSEKKSLEDIIRTMQFAMYATYPSFLSEAIKKPVFAALPGTSSNIDSRTTQYGHGPQLMHIGMGKKYNDESDKRPLLKFYKNALGIQFGSSEDHYKTFYDDLYKAFGDDYDPTFKRGYGIYEPSKENPF